MQNQGYRGSRWRAVATLVLLVFAVTLGRVVVGQSQNKAQTLSAERTQTKVVLLGTGTPTQREYLGCLAGEIVNDTLWVRELKSAADLKQLQFAVAGNCDAVDRFVGTWHTHPYRAGPDGRALKERGLSALDLDTFAAARDLITLVMWDMDSIDVAAKAPDGSVRHPVPLSPP